MNELALFAGAGGGILGGFLAGWTTVAAVEIDPFCREVLLRRQRDGLLSVFPIWDDIRTFDGRPWRGRVDVISAGFPCQPFSAAGKRAGEKDERNMWPDTIRILGEVGPRFALLENVSGLLAHEYIGEVFGGLAALGYDCRWDCIPASAVGAPHRRDRLWIVADANGARRDVIITGGPLSRARRASATPMADAMRARGMGGEIYAGNVIPALERRATSSSDASRARPTNVADADGIRPESARDDGFLALPGMGFGDGGGDVADTASARQTPRPSGQGRPTERIQKSERRSGEMANAAGGRCTTNRGASGNAGHVDGGRAKFRHPWKIEPDVGRVVDGVAFGVDRLGAIGNGQVPAVAKAAWHLLKTHE